MNNKSKIVIFIILILLQILVLHFLGQPFFSKSGLIYLWESRVLSPETSQQFFDWYTCSHVVHGFLFYFILHLLFPRLTFSTKLLIAVGLEVSWEVLENTPWVIEAYRQQALAQGYVGDSILNSLSDVLAMSTGFLIAYKIPKWASVLLVILLEVGMAYFVRDNLSINIINFIHPFELIHRWQSGLL